MRKEVTNSPEEPKSRFSYFFGKIFAWIKKNKTFMIALTVILILMITVFVLARTLEAGEFVKNPETGEYIFEHRENDFKFWQFICSPFLLFSTPSGRTVAIIVSFLFVISGVMGVMEKSQVLTYIFDRLVIKFKYHKHLLLVILVTFFMLVGSLIGCFDEVVPFVPLLIILVAKFGYDKHIGITASLFAIAAGFAAGIFNPFVVAIPQQQAGVPTFSGMWMRIVLFFVFLVFTCAYILFKAKSKSSQIDKKEEDKKIEDKKNPTLGNAGIAFGISVLLGFTMVILILFVPALKETIGSYSLLFLAAFFLIGGILTAIITKMPAKSFLNSFTNGIKPTIMAAILLILASSISYILNASQRMHTILYGFIELTAGFSPLAYVFIFFLLFLLFSVFIASGSAKATLLIPILAPIAEYYGILYPMFLAFALADGIASLVYPTNPILIVILNITKTSYGEYIKKNWIYFLGFFAISVLMIWLSYQIGYNAQPF